MKITIRFGIEKGIRFENIYVDGANMNKFDASRKLTGTTNEDGSGIFNYQSCTFSYGDQTKTFKFENPLDVFKMSASDYIAEINNRITIVRNWVKSIDSINTIKFEVHD